MHPRDAMINDRDQHPPERQRRRQQQHLQQTTTRKNTIAILTLAKHQRGVWITKLVDELRRRRGACNRRSTTPDDQRQHPFTVEIVTVESLDLDQFSPSSSPPWDGVVNRVSDAADPVLVKSTLAILHAAELWNIPVFNGPRSYSICCNKVLHHHVFARSGLRTPRSVVLNRSASSAGAPIHVVEYGKDDPSYATSSTTGTTPIGRKLSHAARRLMDMGCQWPVLIKPNSAGFGAGIKIFANEEELLQFATDVPTDPLPSEDGVALLQEYVRPADDFIYRVWFLRGRVQCGVRRMLLDSSNPTNDFTAGCAGGSCSLDYMRKKSKMGATTFSWAVTDDVKEDIARILRVIGDDCDAGSIELLYDKAGCKVYFDLNLLSTLPLVDGSIGNDTGVWPGEYNPWSELSEAIIGKLAC